MQFFLRLIAVVAGVFLFTFGCSPKGTSITSTHTTPKNSANASGKYAEDLSIWRPKVVVPSDTSKTSTTSTSNEGKGSATTYVEPKFAVNQALDAVLDSISEINRGRGTVDGFTIQVYSGIKREEALNVKRQLNSSVPKLEAEVQYAQPNFRVRVGKYYDRLQAQRDYAAVKEYFPDAIVIPDKIPIK